MALPDVDSSVGSSFGLEFDGVVIKDITEVAGLKMEQDVIELKENTPDGEVVVKRLPGRWKSGEVTLTRGLTSDSSFHTWVKDAQLGKITGARKGGAIVVYDYQGAAIKRYTMVGAWPTSVEISSLRAGDANVVIEKLVLTYERLEVH